MFIPNARRLVLIDSLRATAQHLQAQPASFQRDTALFFALDRYRYHYFSLNRPFTELTQTMLILPDSMYRVAARHNWAAGLIIAAVRRADAISYLGDKVAAIRLYKEAIGRCQLHPLPHEQGIALINLAACFAYRKNVTRTDWQQTTTYMKEALGLARRYNDIENIHQYYNLMGDYYVIRKQYAEALPFYEAEQPLMAKHQHLSGYRTNLAYLGICYLQTNQAHKAWPYLNQFFSISNTDQGTYATYLHYVVIYELGVFYLRKRNYRQALVYQRQYETNLRERTLFDHIGHYEAMSQIYAGLGNYAKAYAYQQRYLAVRDSLKIDDTSRRLSDIEAQLASQRQQNQIRALQNRALQEQNQTQRAWLLFLGSGFAFFICLVGLLLYSGRLRKQAIATQLALMQQKRDTNTRIIDTQDAERQRIAADLHDDLGGTLATIRRRLADIRQHLHDPKVAQDLDDLEPLIQKSGHDLRRISHNLMPPEFARLGLAPALEQLVRNQPPQPTQFSFVLSGQETRLPLEIELNAYRIVSELVQNIHKHAQAQRAAVQLLYHTDKLTITVEDDGLGNRSVTKSTQSTGIGLKNSSLRAEYIGATLWREVSEAGTLVVLDIPYPSPMYAARTSLPHSPN
ncbi:hypothetical protein J2I47_20585 [Fibrella sp. HMF5335]|uniref:Histidine kinase/HSP90-like ATPase domain-containing protein n=2 Tax=Fibrella rubiginis TaxID=2817060 RepID=A0A939K382_9BACT|nr:hypothetical protein [Fibrella rubiginis]